VDRVTADSLIIRTNEYKVDVIIFATGYRSSATGTPADKANMTIIGKKGISMSTERPRIGPMTLHGVVDTKFLNLFLSGPHQAGVSSSYVCALDECAKHAAYILSEAKRRANGKASAVAPTAEAAEAAEDWAARITMYAGVMAPMLGCTPGYYNLEGDVTRVPVEYQSVMARSTIWGAGIDSWLGLIEKWRVEGRIDGIEVRV
jgi:hypothetical protein